MRRAGWLVLAVALPRLLALAFNENLGGDAIARVWLAHRWLEAPRLITSFDGGAQQFGPLHIYLLALAEWCWPSLLHAGRVLSALLGIATAWPLYRFTARWFGERAATLTVLLFAAWGVHVQCSATSSSEALNLLLVMGAVATFERRWAVAAVLLNLACATRYDSWLLVPMFALAAAGGASGPWRGRLWRVVRFGAASSVFAVAWLLGNALARGDAFFPFHFIDAFHRAWWPTEASTWGEGWYRVLCLGFWPGAALMTLTPLVAVPAYFALRRAWGEHVELRWLVLVILVPTVLYGVRGAMFESFAPLARFTLKEVLFLLPFAGWWLSGAARWVQVGAVAALATWSVGLAATCWTADEGWPSTLRAISPVYRMEPRLRAASQWLEQNARDGLLVVDEDPQGFDDLVVSYYSGRPFDAQLRRRHERYRELLGARSPRWLVLIDGGRMTRDGEVSFPDATHLDYRGARFVARRGGHFRIYEREP